jgi:hypothetical protein
MKFSLPMPGGGTGMTLFSKLIRTKDLRKLQGDDPKSTKPKLTVNLIFKTFQLPKAFGMSIERIFRIEIDEKII